MLKIKVCGMTERSNLLDVAAARPDFVGFIFAHSPRQANAALLNAPLFPGIQRVGVFIDPTLNDMESRTGQLDFIQLHGNESPEFARAVRSMGFGVIKAFAIHDRIPVEMIERYSDSVDYVLLDTAGPSPGGNGRSFDWTLLNDYTCKTPFFLSGGISPADAAIVRTIRCSRLAGVDINSRFERSPGKKDAALVQKFIKTVRSVI